ncbi:MAG: nucleotidyl transferase AbiEii/AbiGii toxin family protein [Planctomycetes bacterium]|nr:nucleotidyl transferase AbiEii/AbiGii toxin family protein [Planctomycetota bacterium]
MRGVLFIPPPGARTVGSGFHGIENAGIFIAMKDYFRKATADEIEFFEKGFYPLQDEAFEAASIYGEKIYLTGGTALSRFYFDHRLSDDLDIFTTTGDLKLIASDLAARLQGKGCAVEIEKLDVYFGRIFAVKNNLRLKIDLVREFNLWGPLIKTPKGIFINNLEDIGANKISAFEDRAEIKDIIDLFFILKRLPIERLFEIADTKRIPISYESLLAVQTTGITGKALLLKDVDEGELSAFVNLLREKTEEQIKKKEALAANDLQRIIDKLLWDFPREDRRLNSQSLAVIKRRLDRLPLPERKALETCLGGRT